MSASLVISIIALIVVSTMAVCVTVLVSRALAKAFSTISSMDARSGKRQEMLLDRLCAIRWEDLAALRSTQDGEDGGFYPPTPDKASTSEATRIEVPTGFGGLRNLTGLTTDEQDLLDEDFDEGEVRS